MIPVWVILLGGAVDLYEFNYGVDVFYWYEWFAIWLCEVFGLKAALGLLDWFYSLYADLALASTLFPLLDV